MFQWDSGNEEKNWNKHGVSNEECESIFLVNQFILLKDEAHSIIENRYIIIGVSKQGRALTLIVTIRVEYVRIISAHSASKKERNFYEKNFKIA